jgi:hypothetical protein
MLRLIVLLLISMIISTAGFNIQSQRTTAALAIKGIIDEYYAKTVHDIEFISFGVKSGQGDKMIEEVLKLGNLTVPTKVSRDMRMDPKQEYVLENPSVLMFDSAENYAQKIRHIVFQSGSAPGQPHLVYFADARTEDYNYINLDRFYSFANVAYLTQDSANRVHLVTVVYHPNSDNCHPTFMDINTFRQHQGKWDNQNFFVEKFRNFNKCPIFFRTGFKVFAEPIVAEDLNATFNETDFEFGGKNEFTFFYDFIPNLTIAYLDRSVYVVGADPMKIYIPPGETYSAYEKMLLPFDTSTWMLNLLLVVFAMSAILTIKLARPDIQNAFFGENNRSPAMNFISIVINGSQRATVAQNVPRISIAIIMFWSMIMR